ncbi:hypothetical protein ACJX0J_041886, partial [Zea mays]
QILAAEFSELLKKKPRTCIGALLESFCGQGFKSHMMANNEVNAAQKGTVSVAMVHVSLFVVLEEVWDTNTFGSKGWGSRSQVTAAENIKPLDLFESTAVEYLWVLFS